MVIAEDKLIVPGKRGQYEITGLLTSREYRTVGGSVHTRPFLIAGARDISSGLPSIVKFLNPDLSYVEKAKYGTQLRNEIQALQLLGGQGVVAIRDVDPIMPQGYLFMVRARCSLGDMLDNYHGDVSRSAAVAAEIVQHLQRIHDAGIIHRDVKPDNILVAVDDNNGDPTPHLAFADFGISISYGQCPIQLRLDPGFSYGTPGYGAPEQMRGDPVSTAADLFGLGQTFRELFGEETLATEPKLEKLVQQMVDIDSSSRPSLPVALHTVEEYL